MISKILVITGPTASGKTRLAVELAKLRDGEVVSADSMQVYRHMDIGTAKPTPEEMEGIPHHMLDVVDPEEDFSVARYVEMAARCVDDILRRGKLPILAGGTGLYIDSLLTGRSFVPVHSNSPLRLSLQTRAQEEGSVKLWQELKAVDPAAAALLHANDEKRIIRALEVYLITGKSITQYNQESQSVPPRYQPLTLNLSFARREDMWTRIDQRVDSMIEQGLVQEVQSLLDRGVPERCTAMQAIGYKEIAAALRTGGSLGAAVQEVKLHTRQYAKRQRTWFRRNQEAKQLVWEQEPDIGSACQVSTKYMVEFGI